MGIAGVGILSTIVAVPMVKGLETGAVVCGVGSVIAKFISGELLVKARIHESILVMCMSNLNTISNLMST